MRVPFSHSMQADINVVPGNNLVEREAAVGEPPANPPPLTSQAEKILARTIERCPKIVQPAEPTWICDVKEALVAVAYRVNKKFGQTR